MTHRGLSCLRLLAGGPLLLAAGLLAGCGAGKPATPANVLLISIDTLRPDHLGCYGYEHDTSPAIDSWAAGGTRFVDVTSAAPWTLPGHASMLTGMYPSRHGVTSQENTLTAPTLATRLREEGYQAWALVNSHYVGHEPFGLMRGFDPERTRYVNEVERDVANGSGRRRVPNRGREITDRALEWLATRQPGPFFFFLHYYDVHSDYSPEPRYRKLFETPYAGPLTGSTDQLIRRHRVRGEALSQDDARWLRQMYDAEIRQLDGQLQRVFVYLEESGLADETVVVLSSDHGEEFGEHGGVLHGRTQYQELLAIPLILRGPGVPSGRVETDPAHQVDIAPTILGLLGYRPKVAADGVDLSRRWRAPRPGTEPRYLYGEADHNNRNAEGNPVTDVLKMIRRGDEKLLLDRRSGSFELYDLSSDPGERHDLYSSDPSRAMALRRQLERFMARARRGETIPPPEAEALETLRALGYVD